MKVAKLFLLTFLFAQAVFAEVIPVTLENLNYRPLGAGFDGRKSLFRGDCVEVTGIKKTERHMPSGSMSLKLEASQASLASKLGLSAGGRYRSGVTTTSASAEYLNESKSNSFSIVYNYISEDFYQEYAENSVQHPIKPRPGIEGYLKDSRTFFNNCGNEYVYSRTLAARLFVMMKVTFVSKQQREKFAATFGVDSPVFSLSGNLEKAQSSFSSSNQISIRVEQQGGDPSKKGRIICPTQANGKPDPECANSSRMVVNCSFGDLKPCMDVIANVIAYANAQDGENFPKQIHGGKNYWVTKLDTRPFVYIGSQYPAEPPKSKEDTFQAEVATLSAMFEEEYDNWRYAHQLATGKVPRLSPRQRDAMNLISTKLLSNMKQLSNGIEACFNFGYTRCSGEVEELRRNILGPSRPTTHQIEELTRPEIFVQWCDLATENPSIHTTIQTLKNYLLEKKILEPSEIDRGDFCVKLDDKLARLRDLDLSNPALVIGDLRPIAALTELRSLKVNAKKITSIEPLKSLVHLEYLDISDNGISDLSVLINMPQLREVKLINNRVKSLDSLKNHSSLVAVDARGNGKLECPLRDPSGCKLLNLNNSTTVSLKDQNCGVRVGAAAVTLPDGSVLVSGGHAADGLSIYQASMAIHTRDRCLSLPSYLGMGRANHSSTLLNDGRVLIAGGYNDTLEIFNPADRVISALSTKFSTSRARHTATKLADGRVVFVGGTSSEIELVNPTATAISTVEIFDPRTLQLVVIGKLEVPRMDHTATLLKDGRILVAGGYQLGRMIDVVEIINPNLGSIEMLDGALETGRSGHAAELLPDGKVLIAGGYEWDAAGKIAGLNTIEVYDPERDEFSPVKDRLEYARGRLSSVVLPDGRIMFIGGDSKNSAFDMLRMKLESASGAIEIFDPATQGVYSAGRLVYPRHLFAIAPVSKRSWLIIGGVGSHESVTSAELIVYR